MKLGEFRSFGYYLFFGVEFRRGLGGLLRNRLGSWSWGDVSLV